MAIDRIYIPTYQRINNQNTYDLLPSKWQDKTHLVVHENEVDRHVQYGRNCVVCEHQGKSLSAVREWIIKQEYRDRTKILMLDDDICQFSKFCCGGIYVPITTSIELDRMFDHLSRKLDKYPTLGMRREGDSNFSSERGLKYAYMTALYGFNFNVINPDLIDRMDLTISDLREEIVISWMFHMYGMETYRTQAYQMHPRGFAPGGLTEYREKVGDPKNEALEDREILCRMFPDIIKIQDPEHRPLYHKSNCVIDHDRLWNYLSTETLVN